MLLNKAHLLRARIITRVSERQYEHPVSAGEFQTLCVFCSWRH